MTFCACVVVATVLSFRYIDGAMRHRAVIYLVPAVAAGRGWLSLDAAGEGVGPKESVRNDVHDYHRQ